MSLDYGFQERLKFSEGISESADVSTILLAQIPGAENVHRASPSNDRNGTDFWVEMKTGRHLSIDTKVRKEDYAAKAEPDRADDLALETWSVVEKQVVGWTRDSGKKTDYVLWLWKDTGRWCLVSFPMLCAVFSEHWKAWRAAYKHVTQFTPDYGNGYHSECVFVPRREVWRAIYVRFSGIPKESP